MFNLHKIINIVKQYLDSNTIEFFNLRKNRVHLFDMLYYYSNRIDLKYSRYDDLEFWDSNIFYTGCKNGTIICNGKKIIYRKTLPEDFIFLKINASYGNFSKDKLIELKDYLKKLFPEKDTLHYVNKLLASFLFDDLRNKFCYFLYGSGNNSKTSFLRIIQDFLGDFVMSLPGDVLGKNYTRYERPLGRERLTIFNEPQGELNNNALERCRRHFVMFDVNKLPIFDDVFSSFLERYIKIIPFTTKWCFEKGENVDYKADKSFF